MGGDCWVFPAVSCLRSWTQLLQHIESTLEIKGFFPSIWLLKLARALSYPTTDPACAFHTTRTLHMWSSSSPRAHHCSQQQLPWREGWIFFSVGSGKSSAGNWQCDQNHVKSLCAVSFEGTYPWPSHRGLTTLVPLALLLLNSWLGMEPVAAWTWLSILWTYPLSADWSGTFIIGNGDGFCRLCQLWLVLEVCHYSVSLNW